MDLSTPGAQLGLVPEGGSHCPHPVQAQPLLGKQRRSLSLSWLTLGPFPHLCNGNEEVGITWAQSTRLIPVLGRLR